MTQETLDFLQTSYRDTFTGIAALLGDLVIVTGVTDLGADYSDGWVCISGEILPFIGGTKAANIIVEEIVTQKTFADAVDRDAWYERHAKCASSGGNPVASFVRLQTIKSLAPLASPALTGTPTAPTAAPGTNTTQLATTAFVKAAIDLLVASAPGALDTLNELAAALGNDSNFAATVTSALAGKLSNSPGSVNASHVNTSIAVTGGLLGLDADTITKPGIYLVNSNGPASSTAIVIVVPGLAIGFMTAVGIQLSGGGVGDMYSRVYNSGWGSWTLINDASA